MHQSQNKTSMLATDVKLDSSQNKTSMLATDVKLDSTVVHLDRIPLLWGLFILEESNCTSKRVHIFSLIE